MATRRVQKNPRKIPRRPRWPSLLGQGGANNEERPWAPVTRGKVVSWTLKPQFLFAFFFAAREDQPVLLRSRAICRLSQIFSEIPQDRHRPPSDLADGLMRNSTSGLDKRIGIPVPWARISGGHQLGKLANNSPRACQLHLPDAPAELLALVRSATSKRESKVLAGAWARRAVQFAQPTIAGLPLTPVPWAIKVLRDISRALRPGSPRPAGVTGVFCVHTASAAGPGSPQLMAAYPVSFRQ